MQFEVCGEEQRKASTHPREAVLHSVVLTACVWVAHFFHAKSFGVYEDDWNRLPYTAGIGWQELGILIRQAFSGDFSQGRPIHPLLIYLFSFIGFKSERLLGLYALGFGIETGNVLLFHALLQRVFKEQNFALLGSLAFCVFPADTTQPLLTHAFGLQTALCMLLVAFHLYLSNLRWTSYLATLVMLFTYETPYLIFATAPMLKFQSRKEYYKHWSVMGALLMGVLLLRRFTGEERVVRIGPEQLIAAASNTLTGPVTCIVLYFARPVEALLNLRGWNYMVTVMAILAFGKIIISSSRSTTTSFVTESAPDPMLTGVLMLMLAYPLTFTTAGISVAGRGTRVHMAAVLGASILFAWLSQRLLIHAANRSKLVLRGGWIIVCVLCLLIGFCLVVQQDYVLSWQ